ncbi:MAG: hypothetical protein RIM99_02100 [Cyclobacteriaceae bacterium]
MENFLIYSHIFSGGAVLLLGLISIIRKKGSRSHKLIGKIYVGAMWWICISAFSIIIFYRFSAFLMVISVITFYSSFIGVRVLHRRKPGSEKWYDWLVSTLTSLFGAGLIIYAVFIFERSPVLAILSTVFGLMAFSWGIQDIRFFFKKESDEKKWWLHQHISAMGGSYIAAITAFAVQNGEIFGLVNHNWLLWVLPGIIGSPIISIVVRKQKKKEKIRLATL